MNIYGKCIVDSKHYLFVLFFNNFSEKTNVRKYFSNSFFKFNKMLIAASDKLESISRQDYSWTAYSWLINPSSGNDRNIIERIFDSKINLKRWEAYYNFFIKLYKTVFLCNLSDDKTSASWTNTILRILFVPNSQQFLIQSYGGVCVSIIKYASLTFSYISNSCRNLYKKLQHTPSRNSKNTIEWNLIQLHQELLAHPYLTNSITGLYFFNSLNYSKFNAFLSRFSELWTVNLSLKNTMNSAKINRWLYRYSILHRKILKNSHKITMSKRLLNSGFYNNRLFTKNIWGSEHFTKYGNNEQLFNNLFNIYYNRLYSTGTPATWNKENDSNNITRLSHYETSFFWFLKRFYNLNTLQSNHVKSSTSLATTNFRNTIEIVDNKDSELSKYLTLLSYLLKSYNFSTSPFYPFTKNTSLNFINNDNQSSFINDFLKLKIYFYH
jgi:hypothetical protein